MASIRQIRSRLRSTQSTKQIMRAMQLVSASKLKRAQGRLYQARAMLEFLDGLLDRVLASTPDLTHPLTSPREGASVLVVFTSDAGLAGAYNTNLIHLAESYLRRDSAKRTQVVYIGKKGHRYFTKRGWPALDSYVDLAGRPNLARAEEIGRALMSRFLAAGPATGGTSSPTGTSSAAGMVPPPRHAKHVRDSVPEIAPRFQGARSAGGVSDVQLLFSQFVSSSVYRPTILKWLPVTLSAQPQPSRARTDYIFEPSPERVFEDLLPRWALVKFQLVMLEAFTSEHSARMIAMKNATDNAEELLRALTMQRNKIRQASITKELSEIVGTAEALK